MFSIATSAPQHIGFDGLQQIRWATAVQEKGSLSYTPQWSGAEHVTGRFAPGDVIGQAFAHVMDEHMAASPLFW